MQRLPLIDLLAETSSGLVDGVEVLRRITYQGPLSLTQAVLIGIGLSLLCGLGLWTESRFTGRKWLGFFWPLRVIAVAVIMWMLVEPAQTTVERRLERKSLAIAADISGSMETVDPPDHLTDLRWAMALRPPITESALAGGDRLLVATTEAQRRLTAAYKIAQTGRGFQRCRPHLDTALRACESAVKQLEMIERAAEGESASKEQQTAGILTEFRDHILPGIRRQLNELDHTAPQAWTAGLRSQVLLLERLADRTQGLVAAVADVFLAPGSKPSFHQSSSVQSRRQKVAGLLQVAENSWLRTAEQQARIHRWTFSRDVLAVKPGDWSQGDQVNVQKVGQNSDGAEASQTATNLTAMLEELGRTTANDRLEAVVLLSDGRHNAIGSRDPLEIAGSLGRLPIYIVPVGDDRLVRDILVHHLDAPRAVDRDDKIVLESLITSIDCEGESIEVQLVAKDAAAGEEVIDRFRFTPDSPRQDQRVTFTTQRSELGRYEFQVRVAPVAEEATRDNNQETVTVDVVENNIKVLLADNSPRWEFRFLSRLFERDEHIQYDQVAFHPVPNGTGELAGDPRLPTEIDEWSRYRVVLLGDLTPAQLPVESQQGLREFVTQHGGTLILIAGAEAMPAAYTDQPLGELLPVTSNGGPVDDIACGVALTAEGRMASAVQISDDPAASERAWREAYDFVPLQWMSEFRHPKPTAHTLLTAVPQQGSKPRGEDNAFLCWQPVGRGRVVYFSAPASYRLRARHGDRYHHAFWGQLLRWSIAADLATGSKTVRIHTDKRRYDATESVQVVVQLRSLDGEPVRLAKVQAAVVQHDKSVGQTTLTADEQVPGRYLGKFDRLPAGNLQVMPTGDDVRALLATENFTGTLNSEFSIVRELDAEMKDTRSNPALLARLAEVTGGQVIPPTALSEIINLISLTPRTIEKEFHQPLWDNWWCLGLVSGCLILEWTIRKRTNLL